MTKQWPCKISAETTGNNGRKLRIEATIEGAGDIHKAMRDYVAKKRNSYAWLGVEITAITPLMQVAKIIYEG